MTPPASAPSQDGELERRRAEGKLDNLARELAAAALHGDVGIAHTRWATHGAPTVGNAHPHIAGPVALVHNGIIENFKPLRDELIADGRKFLSETDSEVVAHLVAREVERGASPEDAVATVLPRLHGAFAIAFLFRDHPDLLIGARMGAPLTVGYGEGENYLGSDALALAPLTQRIAYLDEGDWVVVARDRVEIFDRANKPVEREIVEFGRLGRADREGQLPPLHAEGDFRAADRRCPDSAKLCPPVRGQGRAARLSTSTSASVNRVTIVACGTSFYAGMVAKYWFEQFARVPVDIDVASEFRYREPVLEPGGLALFISPVGRDRRHARRAAPRARARGRRIAVVVNVPTSSMAREADLLLPTHAGPEIGVASTKAFTCQLAVLAALAANLARAKGRLSARGGARDRRASPAKRPRRSTRRSTMTTISRRWRISIAPARDVLYLGRGPDYPMALEGALKLKEISYIHAEGYAAGEMKHGPIALIDELVPVIVLAPSGPLFEKTVSNMQEVRARGGKIVLITDAKGLAEAGEGCMATIEMPEVHPLIAPLVYAVPVQLLAYHVAVAKGTDVDQPRNLAKSVTVE